MKPLSTSLVMLLFVALSQTAGARPIKVAIDAEFGIPGSTSAQAIQQGAQVAIDEINTAGGVLGRSLELVLRDNRGIPARAGNNLRELAADPDVVAVMCGKYSPVVVDLLPEIHRLKIPFLDPWAAADPITAHGFAPDYVFRLSMRDTIAVQAMLRHAKQRGLSRLALLLPNSDWGRSVLQAAQTQSAQLYGQKIIAWEWYNFGDKSLAEPYRNLHAAGPQAVILVANEQEGVIFINELAGLGKDRRLPVLAHWGVSAGRFFDLSHQALREVDLVFVQTFSFLDAPSPAKTRLLAGVKRLTGNGDARKVASPVGVGHAYDMVHLLAQAIRRAGRVERTAIRAALEGLGAHQGAVRAYARPFAPGRHDALDSADVFMARFAGDGAIVPLMVGKP